MSETIQHNKLTSFIQELEPTSLNFNENRIASAANTLENSDFPTTRTEAWKYTRVAKIANLKLKNSLPGTLHLDQRFLISKDAYTFIFENGKFIPSLSSTDLPKELSVCSLSSASDEEIQKIGTLINVENEIFNAINTRFATDGLFVHVSPKALIKKPIQIIHILSGKEQISNFRNFFVADKFSQATILMGYYTANGESCFANVVSEIIVEENASLSIDKLQYEDEGNYHIGTEQVLQHKDSTFSISTVTLNGSFVRNNLNIEVNGTNCSTHLNGAYLLKGNQHVDNHTLVDHKMPHCESNELYKGVIDDNSTAVFNGKVFVRKDAQKINAFQSNGNVLLSDNASMNSKPELEIYADDVKCSHGSTTGQLDENAVFYLRARGLSEKAARNLMVSAFIEDVLSKVSSEEMLQKIHEILKERYGWEF
jgi:Fe-S cluster assembly protein SufD